MKVILTEKVAALGNLGELVNVSPGYGRNYLIPNKLAVLASDANKKELDNQKRALQKRIAEEKATAEVIKKKIDGLKLEFVRRIGGNGKLFGSITNAELAKELAEKQIEVERRQIVIANPIKSLGDYAIKVKLFAGVDANFNVTVKMDPAQIAEEKEKQATAAQRKAQRAAEAKLQEAQADVEAEKAKEIEAEEQTAQEIKDFEA